MTLEGKNKKSFSYTNHDVREKKFINKDFNKSASYHSNFSQTEFINTSFLATKFKFSSFYGTVFKNCVVTGTLFRGCNLQNSVFENCIIRSSVFDKCKLKGAKFIKCYVNPSQFKKYPDLDFSSCYIIEPKTSMFSAELLETIESLREHDLIRRSCIFHLKKGKLNLISVMALVDKFGEKDLIELLPLLPTVLTNQFYTISYIEKFLLKLKESSNI